MPPLVAPVGVSIAHPALPIRIHLLLLKKVQFNICFYISYNDCAFVWDVQPLFYLFCLESCVDFLFGILCPPSCNLVTSICPREIALRWAELVLVTASTNCYTYHPRQDCLREAMSSYLACTFGYGYCNLLSTPLEHWTIWLITSKQRRHQWDHSSHYFYCN